MLLCTHFLRMMQSINRVPWDQLRENTTLPEFTLWPRRELKLSVFTVRSLQLSFNSSHISVFTVESKNIKMKDKFMFPTGFSSQELFPTFLEMQTYPWHMPIFHLPSHI